MIVFQVTNQKRKKSSRHERTTCRPKPNSGPVNRMSTVQAHRMINAIALRILCFIMGFAGSGFGQGGCVGCSGSFIGLSGEQFLHFIND